MNNVMQRLRAKRAQEQQQALPSYAEIVGRLGRGEDPAVEEVEAVLTAAGKTEEQLEQDLRRYQFQAYGRSGALEFVRHDEKVRAAERELEEARAEQERLTAELARRVEAAEKALTAADWLARGAIASASAVLGSVPQALERRFMDARQAWIRAERETGPGAVQLVEKARSAVEGALRAAVDHVALPGCLEWEKPRQGPELAARRSGGFWLREGRPAHQASFAGPIPGMGGLEQPLRTGVVTAPAGL
mgnify:CR=1 FL=1